MLKVKIKQNQGNLQAHSLEYQGLSPNLDCGSNPPIQTPLVPWRGFGTEPHYEALVSFELNNLQTH